MRIKLSKQNWRLVGQKMGWLKRAQVDLQHLVVPIEDFSSPVVNRSDSVTATGPHPLGRSSTRDTEDRLRDRHTGEFTFDQTEIIKKIENYTKQIQRYLDEKRDSAGWGMLARGLDYKSMPKKTDRPSIDNAKSLIMNNYGLMQNQDIKKAKESSESPEQKAAFKEEFQRVRKKLRATQELILEAFMRWWDSDDGKDFRKRVGA